MSRDRSQSYWLKEMDCWRNTAIGIGIEIEDNANLFDPDFDPENGIE
jgi:hypothetical protein